MKKIIWLTGFLTICALNATSSSAETLIYHDIKVDAQGVIAPWFDPNPATAYDHMIELVWNFWDNMRPDDNGHHYYMSHQVWTPGFPGADDPRGLGGDQFQMALSSWRLLYAYTGNDRIKQNMRYIADYYISHSLSPSNALWPDLPFPYNTLISSEVFDGDMVIGRGFLQPDKAGSLGLELIDLYKMTIGDSSITTTPNIYRDTAFKIAKSLAAKLQAGDAENSPLPFKVNAYTGAIGDLRDNSGNGKSVGLASYTTNWAPTMEMFLALEDLDPKNAADYHRSFLVLLNWMKQYPLKTNKWGPFFEDVQGWSDTQINAITFARFMMEHPQYFPDWKTQVPPIFDWVYKVLGNDKWKQYGVEVVNEQTSFAIPGQSHMAREGATELLYSKLSGDESRKQGAIAQLNWATYSVDSDGKNCFPFDGVWLTDGFGDYVRHFLRAMAVYPELAPATADHLLSSTSVVQQASYDLVAGPGATRVFYRSFDPQGTEVLRMASKPSAVQLEGQNLDEMTDSMALKGYRWTPMTVGGVLEIVRDNGYAINILN